MNKNYDIYVSKSSEDNPRIYTINSDEDIKNIVKAVAFMVINDCSLNPEDVINISFGSYLYGNRYEVTVNTFDDEIRVWHEYENVETTWIDERFIDLAKQFNNDKSFDTNLEDEDEISKLINTINNID